MSVQYFILHFTRITATRWHKDSSVLDVGVQQWIWNQGDHISCAIDCLRYDTCVSFELMDDACIGYTTTRRPTKSSKRGLMFGSSKRKGRDGGNVENYVKFGDTGLEIRLHISPRSWEDAAKVCEHEGGTLVKAYPSERRQLYLGYISDKLTKGGRPFWIGLYDKFRNDTWYWIDGTPIIGRDNFAQFEPDHIKKGKEENCVGCSTDVFGRKHWFDMQCDMKLKFTCTREMF